MNIKQVLDRVSNGERILICEYRSSKLEQINWRDKDTGRPLSATAIRHVLESGPDSLVVNERTGEGFDAAKWVAPAKKGQRVVLHFTEFKTERGMISARGTLEAIDNQ